jgi:DNA-binding NarL/FixJ family response regulator
MRTIILISGDPKTQEEIKSLMPTGVGLDVFAALEDCPRPNTPQAEGRYSGSVLLMELAGDTPPAGNLEFFRLAGVPLVAVIQTPSQRSPAFHAGFADYLLLPCSPSELKNRLERVAQTGAASAQASSTALERERQAAVGRLTSYFCHAVNNSMQTIRGSIDLAREEPGLSPGIDEYLAICRRETDLIGAKINRLRQIYRPKPSAPEALQLEALARESLKMAADDLLRNNITVKEQIEASLPAIQCTTDRIFLAFLMILFYLSEDLGSRGGGELRVQAARDRGDVLLTLTAIPGAGEPGMDHPAALPPGLEPAGDLIRSERGCLEPSSSADGSGVLIRFPAEGN